jgi:hypothetical protein
MAKIAAAFVLAGPIGEPPTPEWQAARTII